MRDRPSLPSTERILLGPGPSTIPTRVMRAMAAPVLSHLDGDLLTLMDDVRERLTRLFRATDDTLAIAVSGTGTSGMEALVANLVQDGTRVLAIVTGYFGDRLAEICRRYGGRVRRLEVERGRAVDPQAVREELRKDGADLVACVHAETSTGVLNPVESIAAVAREHDALILVDAVTSLGGHPVEVEAWGLDAVYSCTQKCVGAPSGLAPIAWTRRARSRKATSRSFYFDLELLEDYWVRRKYHHTLSSTLLYALHDALVAIEEEGLEARWARHRRHHQALAHGLEAMGLELLPPPGERLWTLNAIRVPEGVDEAAVRRALLTEFGIEIGAGLGPLAGRIWRVGFMGASSTRANLALFLSALDQVLRARGFRCSPGAGVAALAELDEFEPPS
ncbi:MAG TPA: alanine--glyoxylate aminotransferase family protein [Vicinamibacterales bacterium]|nr:alanine--glyoxylate aminotransferase family protein [Vicinamibacterales bacterium]